ncbi:12127_t:CDS:2 [Entrophospora sp. SA101]|nr:12127_t:CDS:2 [Entrophospora sp. SA101]
MRNLADDSQAQLPIADLLFQHLLTSKANGGQHYDWSSAVGALRLASGIPFETPIYNLFKGQ